MRGDSHSEIDNSSMGVAQEAISTERTVFALNLECYFYDRFKQSLGNHSTVFIVLNMSAHSLGRAASIGPETALAKAASKLILATLDRVPRILTDAGEKPVEPFSGHIEFKRVYFKYPTRNNIYVLKNFSHVVTPGQTVAFVGQSGCGKSTLLQLVQRLYDPSDLGSDSGIFFDGHNLRNLAPSWIRRQIGIVSQEPNLFNTTIRENIAYGDNTREVPMEDIIEAARLANIHDFISTLPEAWMPAVGSTEHSLVVAHRLSTVENAELVVVLQDGRKIEAGPPRILLDAKGVFYALHHVELAMNL
ncbi:hypothetical protein AHF37_07634 [Paragonimus kellicotti]|nr:hypothetical protein AHF37_07634 [Paragonimus kellicotti]